MTKQATLKLVDAEAPERIFVKNHTYSLDGKAWMPGVTSILRIQDALGGSDGLVRWAVNLAAKAAFDEATRSEHPEFDDALRAAIAATEEPRNKGSRVHDGIDAAANDFDHTPNPADGRLWYHFSRALIKHRIEILATEQYVVGDGFGGTLDIYALVNGKPALVDTKSGKFKDSFALQIAAYSSAQWMAPKSTGTPVVAVPDFEEFYALMLSDDGAELIPLLTAPGEREAAIEHFRFLLGVHQRLHAWNKKEKAA